MLFVVLRYVNGVIFMSHTVFFYPRNTQTHTDSFPQSEVFKRILVKDFIWGLVAYGKKSWRKSLKKIYGLWPEINIFSFNLISLKYFLRSRNIFKKISSKDFLRQQPPKHPFKFRLNSDDCYFCPYRTWLGMLLYILRALSWARETIGLSARLCLYVIP